MIDTAREGFVFTLDATLALLITSTILAVAMVSFAQIKPPATEELLILQKEHDLMKHWLIAGATEHEMTEQIEKLFGNIGVKLGVNGKVVLYRKASVARSAITSRLVILNTKAVARKIVLTVFN